MKKLLALAAVLATTTLSGCTDEASARRTLNASGFKDVQITGYEWFSCGEDDASHTGFIATNPNGARVSGVVCCGLVFKACTIRF